jgi:hypothetical protein
LTNAEKAWPVRADRLLRCMSLGNDSLATRYGDRRLKSAKARSRGSWALAGSEHYGDFDISAELVCGREADTPSASVGIGREAANRIAERFHKVLHGEPVGDLIARDLGGFVTSFVTRRLGRGSFVTGFVTEGRSFVTGFVTPPPSPCARRVIGVLARHCATLRYRKPRKLRYDRS